MIVVYTAIFGTIPDELYRPVYEGEGVEYHAYVDRVRGSRHGWQLRPKHFTADDPRRQARQHKLLSHELYPEAEYTLWLDGCLSPLCDPRQLVDQYLGEHDICVFRHMQRNCVYQELEACLQLRKDDPQVMRRQVNTYRREGYPYNRGLAETTAVLRRHSPQVKALNEAWWRELVTGSVRDQLSFDVVCWRLGVPYATFDGTRTRCPHYKWRPHR